MDIFSILQMIIALIFIYLIISLVVAELQEQLAAFFQWRARNLIQAINIFVGDNSNDLEKSFAAKLFNLNNSQENSKVLASGFNQFTNPKIKRKWKLWFFSKETGPSYLEPKVFATSLVAIINKDLDLELSQNKKLFSDSDQDSISKTLEERLDKINKSPNDNSPEWLKKLHESDKDLYPNLISKLLEIAKIAKLKKDNPTLKDLINEIANTYEKVMERTSGVYKRNAKGVSLLLGIIIAPVFNIDTFHIVDQLYKDVELRESFESSALEVNQLCSSQINSDNDNSEALAKCLNDFKSSFEDEQTLPVGWNEDGWFNGTQIQNQGRWQIGLGWFISAIAIAMGAPFWFDLLAKVINVRNTVRPLSPEETAPNQVAVTVQQKEED